VGGLALAQEGGRLSLAPQTSPTTREAEAIVRDAVETGRLDRVPAERLARALGDESVHRAVREGAFESKLRGKGDVVTVSRNVFLPLTNLCRDRCAYCTFAKLPDSPEAHTYTLAEVDQAVREGVRAGAIEALFCLGDKPEIAYKSHRLELARRGYASTSELLVEACRVAFEGGMLPHTNAGILSQDEMARLRPWNASMGLMLETTSRRLRGKGMAHYYAPDKEPATRIRMHEEAGELRIPFTSGILLGIGETDQERVDTLITIRDLAEKHGHIREVIVQPFHPKPGTPMHGVVALGDAEVAGWVAMARLILGPGMNVQAPPNLAPEMLELLARSGLNDWGGVSPLTIDFINPEAPWPKLRELRRRTEQAGGRLRERLPAYPEDVIGRPELFDPTVRAALPRFHDDEGFARPPEGGEKEAA
jgi:FO synthase